MNNLRFLKKREPIKFFARLSFLQVFLLWLLAAIIFAIIFLFSSSFNKSGILHNSNILGKSLLDFSNILYFSFITLTSTGYGDFVPLGLAKIFAVIEVIIGLIIFGVFISKFVSLKQEMILEEIYKISLEERINRLRMGLSLFRANVTRVIERINSGILTEKEINDFSIMTTTLQGHVQELTKFILESEKKHEFVSGLDLFTLEILLSATDGCFARILDLFNVFKNKKAKWKKNKTIIKDLKKVISLTSTILNKCENKKLDNELVILIKEMKRKIEKIEKILG